MYGRPLRGRLREVSCFSLQNYYTRNLSTPTEKPGAARNEGVRPRRKKISLSRLVSVIITSWFGIALDEIRTRRILREKADCKQSSCGEGAAMHSLNNCDDEINDIYLLTQIVHCEKNLYIYLLKIE